MVKALDSGIGDPGSIPARYTTIENFIGELTPVITDLGKGYNTALTVGDFNINLLQLNERKKFNDYLELMCTNSFYPKITLPTRFANKVVV